MQSRILHSGVPRQLSHCSLNSSVFHKDSFHFLLSSRLCILLLRHSNDIQLHPPPPLPGFHLGLRGPVAHPFDSCSSPSLASCSPPSCLQLLSPSAMPLPFPGLAAGLGTGPARALRLSPPATPSRMPLAPSRARLPGFGLRGKRLV